MNTPVCYIYICVYCSQSEGSLDDKLISLPSFLEALASIVTQLDNVCVINING